MIISHLIGGLGNQMFQYAAGRALSIARGQALKLDISSFDNYHLHHGFELQRVFDCPIEVAVKTDIHRILGWQSYSLIRRIVSRPGWAMLRIKEFVIEPHIHFWVGINNVPSECYLMGYWQTENYFLLEAERIRKDFSFRQPMDDRNVGLADQINHVNAVSVHVRRGDYISNPKFNAAHGVCTLNYYLASIRYIAERIQRPHFFIFSDDIEWVKLNLKIDFPHQYVDHNHGVESYNDMRLMSLCKHNIIANSSFSWWGAWLNASNDKIVVAPSQWFINQKNTQDILPRDWIVL